MLDKLRKATGLGLSADEKYERAFDNGVLLRQNRAAIDLFEAARSDAEKRGAQPLAKRAEANKLLYTFIENRDLHALGRLMPVLAEIEEIEAPGSKSDFIRASDLRQEIEARLAHQAIRNQQWGADPIAAHQAAAALFQRLFGRKFVLLPYHWPSPGLETPERLFFYHSAEAAYLQSHDVWKESPDRCGELLTRAISYYQQAGHDRITPELTDFRDRLRRRQTCFLTHLRLQGEGLHYRRYRVPLEPYVLAQIEEQGRKEGNVDSDRSEVVISALVAALIEEVAANRAKLMIDAYHEQVSSRLNSLSARLNALENQGNR